MSLKVKAALNLKKRRFMSNPKYKQYFRKMHSATLDSCSIIHYSCYLPYTRNNIHYLSTALSRDRSFIVGVLLFYAVLYTHSGQRAVLQHPLQLLVFVIFLLFVSACSRDPVYLQRILILLFVFAPQVFIPIGLDPSPHPMWPCSLLEGR